MKSARGCERKGWFLYAAASGIPQAWGSCCATTTPEIGRERHSELRSQGMSLREVGVRLAMEGHVPESGGIWDPARVFALVASMNPAA